MFSNQDLSIYNYFHHYNHVADIGGGAHFNPGSMLLFIPSTKNPFLYNLLYTHEFTHARLSSCHYGKIVFLLRWVSIKLISSYIQQEEKSDFQQTWDYYKKIEHTINRLMEGWILTQEGYATFLEWRYMERWPNPSESNLFKKQLSQFLQKETPYSRGIQYFRQLQLYFSNDLLRNITHEIGNINYLKYLPQLLSNSSNSLSVFYPDDVLDLLSRQLISYKRNRYLIWNKDKYNFINARESTSSTAIARKLIFNSCEETSLEFYDDDNNTVFVDILNHLKNFIRIDSFQKELVDMEREYLRSTEAIYKKGGSQQVLAYPSKKREYRDFVEIIIDQQSISTEEIHFINYITNTHLLIKAHLPNELATFKQKLYQLKNKFGRADQTDFLMRIFPATEIRKYKIPIFRNLYSIQQQYEAMSNQIIEVKCSQVLAEELMNRLKDSTSTITIDDPKEEGFKHWSETVHTTITIIASSLIIINIIRGWLKEKSEEKVQKDINITIEEETFDSLNDFDALEKKLEALKINNLGKE